jgi:hypothetical protein
MYEEDGIFAVFLLATLFFGFMVVLSLDHKPTTYVIDTKAQTVDVRNYKRVCHFWFQGCEKEKTLTDNYVYSFADGKKLPADVQEKLDSDGIKLRP